MPNSVISMLVSLNGMLGSHRYGTGGGGGRMFDVGRKELPHFQGQRIHCTKPQFFISEGSL